MRRPRSRSGGCGRPTSSSATSTAGSWAGPWPTTSAPSSSATPSETPSPAGTHRPGSSSTPTGAAQYTSKDFRDLAAELGVTLSLGRTGQCWDNALSESWFSAYKNELIHTRSWPTKASLRRATFEYIESWYNLRRCTAPSATAAPPPTKPPSTRTPPPRRPDLASTLSVESGQPHVGAHVAPRPPHHIAAGELVVKSVETTLRVLLGTAVKHALEGLKRIETLGATKRSGPQRRT
jgi:hypothetical protein